MDRAPWERIEPLFQQLLELPEPERRPWLTGQCDGDPDLFDEVWEFYRDAVSDDDFLESPLRSRAPRDTGKRIGPYELVSVLGVGGMGTVWLAERVDGQFRQRVALKLVRVGMDTDAVLRRFRNERQLLADLDHPRIAHLLDGGTTNDGRPYLVMEYVQGSPLLDYCDERELSLEARLRLFQKICGAVQHAHELGVVHRDLKPSNVLVDQNGEPRLLDFGIAKVIEAGDQPGLLEQTMTAERFLSPRYASPEQLRGEPVGVSSDVYALGVMLYELLTDRHPYGFETTSWREFEEQVFDRDPQAPSRAVDGSERAGFLEGDLDRVALFALRKEPERRYASAGALSADVGRYLDGLPVRAHPDSLGYRVGKFVQRNRRFVFGTLAFVIGLSLALAFATRSYVRSYRAELEARWSAYAGHVAAAENALHNAHTADARSHLEQAPEELRGWEWAHLRSRLDRSLRQIPGQLHQSLAIDSANGLVALSFSNKIRLHDVESLEVVKLLEPVELAPGRWTGCVQLAFSADGRHVASVWRTGELYVHEVQGGEIVFDRAGHENASVATHPDAELLFLTDDSGQLLELEIATGEVVRRRSAHAAAIRALAVNEERALLATGCWDGSIRIWSLHELELVHDIEAAHGMEVTDLDFTLDGSGLASASLDGLVHIWDVDRGQKVRSRHAGGGFVVAVLFDPSGERLISSAKNGHITTWAVSTGESLGRWSGHEFQANELALDRMRGRVWSVGQDGVKEWSLETQDVRAFPAAQFASSVAFDPRNERFATGGPDSKVRLCEFGESSEQLIAPIETFALELAFSPTADELAVVGGLGDLTILDTRSGSVLRSLSVAAGPHEGREHGVAYSPDGRRIAAVHGQAWAIVHAAETLEPELRLEDPRGKAMRCIAFDPRGESIAIGGNRGYINVFDARTGEVLKRFEPPGTSAAYAITYSTDARRLFSGHADGTIRIWNLEQPAEGQLLTGHSDRLNGLAVHPDGTRLASGSADGTIRIWHLPSGRPVLTLRGHDGVVSDVAFSPDGKALLSCSYDAEARLWESD